MDKLFKTTKRISRSGRSAAKEKRGSTPVRENLGEAGFTLIETVCALVIIMIALLGVAFSISYSIMYNAGNSSRAKTIGVMQQEVERLRSAKFTPTTTDAALFGGQVVRTVNSGNLSFVVTTTIDNNPSTTAVDNEATVASTATLMKEIQVHAVLANPSPGWQTAIPAVVVMRRVKSN